MKSLTVLLLEADPTHRELAVTRLSLLGHVVLACASVEEALAQLSARAGMVHLAIVGLLDASGLGWAIAQLRTAAPAGLPILAVGTEPEACGSADHVLQRPYHLHELAKAIPMVLASRTDPPAMA